MYSVLLIQHGIALKIIFAFCKENGNLGYYKNTMQRKKFAFEAKWTKYLTFLWEETLKMCANIAFSNNYIMPNGNEQKCTTGLVFSII